MWGPEERVTPHLPSLHVSEGLLQMHTTLTASQEWHLTIRKGFPAQSQNISVQMLREHIHTRLNLCGLHYFSTNKI